MQSLKWLDPLVDQCGFGGCQILLLIQTGAVAFASAAIFVILGSTVDHLPLHHWGVTAAAARLLQSAIFIGITVGTIVGGVFADRHGRRTCVVLAYTIFIASAILLITSQGYYVMVAACLLFGAVGGFSLPAINALLVESSPSGNRGDLICFSSIPWFVGELYGAGCVWFLSQSGIALPGTPATGFHWRACMLMGVLPSLPIVLHAYFTLQESPRFLASQRRFRETEQCLALMAAKNGVASPVIPKQDSEAQQDESMESVAEKTSSALRNLQLLMRWPFNASTAGLMVVCMVCNFAYYGLIFALPQILQQEDDTSDLLGGPAVQVFIVTLFKIPGIVLAFLVLNTQSIGHKASLMTLLSLTAMSAWAYPELHNVGLPAGALGAACCLKMATSAAFIVVYVFVLEVYPTQIRSTGMAICTMMGRIGSIMSPIVHSLAVAQSGHDAYFRVVALCAFLCGACALLIPHDTKGMPLTDGDESEGTCLLKK